MKPKLSEKQYELLKSLYMQQGKKLTPKVEEWLKNLPALEARDYIDKWTEKVKKQKENRRRWWNK